MLKVYIGVIPQSELFFCINKIYIIKFSAWKRDVTSPWTIELQIEYSWNIRVFLWTVVLILPQNDRDITLRNMVKWGIGNIHFSTVCNVPISPTPFLKILFCKCSPAVPYFFVANSDYWYNTFKGKEIAAVVKTESEEEKNTFQFSHTLIQHGNQYLTLTSSTS